MSAVGSHHLGGGEEDEDGQRDDDDDDRPELTLQERLGPLLDGLGDLLHLRRALIGGQDVAGQQEAGGDADHAGGQTDVEPGLVRSAELEVLVATRRQRRKEVDHAWCALSCLRSVFSVSRIDEAAPAVRCVSVPTRPSMLYSQVGGAPVVRTRRRAGGDVSDWRVEEQELRRTRPQSPVGSCSAPATSSNEGLSMAGRRPQAPTMPSATRRAPGSIPAILGRPWKTSSSPPVPSLSTHSRFGRPGPGLDPHRLDPAGHLDPVAGHDVGDGRGDTGPAGQRVVGLGHGGGPARNPRGGRDGPRRSAPRRRPGRPASAAVSDDVLARRAAQPGPLHRLAVGAHPLAEPAGQVVRDDGGADVGHLGQHAGDLVGRAVVQEALPHPGVARGGATGRCTRCRRRGWRRPPARWRPGPAGGRGTR